MGEPQSKVNGVFTAAGGGDRAKAVGTVYFNVPGVAIVEWEPSSKAVFVEWQGWATPTEFRAALDAGHVALRQRHSSRWLADCRNLRAVQQSDQEWLDRVWFPQMLAAGLTRMAIVIPKSALALMNVEAILSRVPESEMDVGYFATVEEATAWLNEPGDQTSLNPTIASTPPRQGSGQVRDERTTA